MALFSIPSDHSHTTGTLEECEHPFLLYSHLFVLTLANFRLPGPPLSQESAVVRLLQHNVTVGLGVMGINQNAEISSWSARNARFDVSWVSEDGVATGTLLTS